MSPIEVMARAYCKVHAADCLCERDGKACLHIARGMKAALLALSQMEPTEKMLRAAQEAWLADPLRKSSTIWHAMLDAAVGEVG